jgi:hypothetical protein
MTAHAPVSGLSRAISDSASTRRWRLPIVDGMFLCRLIRNRSRSVDTVRPWSCFVQRPTVDRQKLFVSSKRGMRSVSKSSVRGNRIPSRLLPYQVPSLQSCQNSEVQSSSAHEKRATLFWYALRTTCASKSNPPSLPLYVSTFFGPPLPTVSTL